MKDVIHAKSHRKLQQISAFQKLHLNKNQKAVENSSKNAVNSDVNITEYIVNNPSHVAKSERKGTDSDSVILDLKINSYR